MKTLQTILVISIFSFVSVQISGQVESNREKLLQFSATKTAEFTQKKAEAEEYARLNNLPMIVETDTSYMELMFIDEFGMPQYYITTNRNAGKTISTNQVHPGGSAGLNLDGSGLTVHEWDAGAVLSTHQEFGSRVTQGDGATVTHYHSTHVAGTMIASGVNSDAKGMAPGASLKAFEWNNDNAEMADEAASGALISNHSYGFVRGWHGSIWYGDPAISTQEDYLFGFYDDNAQAWDQIAHDAPYYLIVKSAGNDRNDWGDGTYPCDGAYDCIGQLGIAKNILTVGAIHDIPGGYLQPSDVLMSTFSSWGPADDGRIKPDIVANGIKLISTINYNNYSYTVLSGTSMAAPSVAGSLILLQQHYETLNGSGNLMKAATLKALVIHTADEVDNFNRPDYQYGWGVMNTYKAADLITHKNGNDTIIDELTLTEGGTYQYSFTNTGKAPLKFTIAWTDPPGTPVAHSLDPKNKMLVNDLDLRVTESSNTYYPWSLDKDNPSNIATNINKNDVDNVEVVFIEDPLENAVYTVTVDHDGTLYSGSQNFSIIISPCFGKTIPIKAPIAEDFSADTVPDSWTMSGNHEWLFSTAADEGAAKAGDHTTGGGTNYAWVPAFDTEPGEQQFPSLKTPLIDLSDLENPSITFWYFSDKTDEYEEPLLILDFWDGKSWNILFEKQVDNPNWQIVVIDLSAYSFNTAVQFRFTVYSEPDFSSNGDLLIDDIRIDELPSCPPVGYLYESITESDVHLGWSENGSSSKWQIMLDIKGFDTTNADKVNVLENPYTMSSLTENTYYVWYVRAHCDEGKKSTWVGPKSFFFHSKPYLLMQKILGGSSSEEANSIDLTSDGGYIIAGSASSNDGDVTGNKGSNDYWIVKLSDVGDTTWTKTYGGSDYDKARSIQQTNDEGYIVLGYSLSDDGDVRGNHGGYDVWVVKLNSNGDTSWTKTYGEAYNEFAYSIQQTNDSGYIFAGSCDSWDWFPPKLDYWIVKINKNGDTQWTKTLGGSGTEEAKTLVQTSDNGYIVAGKTRSNNGDVHGNHGSSDVWVVKLNSNGDTTWTKTYGGSSWDQANSIQQTIDGGYIVAGQTYSNDGDVIGNKGGYDSWALKLNNSGEIIWSKTYGGSIWEHWSSIQQTKDGGYVVVGSTSSNDGDVSENLGETDAWVVKLNNNGEIIWSKTLGGTNIDEFCSVKQTVDGNYIIAGYTESNDGDVFINHGRKDFWIVKIAENSTSLSGTFIDSGQNLGISGSTDVALGDMDNDGDLDAVVTKDGAGEANKVWLNDGTGYFTDSGLSFGNAVSWGIALGDLDGDGDLDGFIANDGPNKVYLNNGTNTTHNGQNLGNASSHDVKLADMDNDGDLDAAVANNASGQPNKVWLNNGDGTFVVFNMDLGNAMSWGLDLGDLDGDGDIDGFIANDGPNKVYLNAGPYTSDNGQNLGNASGKSIRLGDMDGDGDLDAVIANDATGQPNIVWLNDGDGDFTDSGLSFGDNLSMGLAIGDLDGDGDLDGFVANNGANKIYLNDGANTADNGQFLGNSNSYAVALGDLDGDGDLDAFVSNYDGPNKVWLNQTVEYQVNAQSLAENVVADKNAVDSENTSTLSGFESYEKDNTSSDVLLENYPDPFTNRTTIRFKVNKTGEIVLKILNQFGKVTDVLYDATATAGQEYKIVFHGDHLPAGIYVILLQGENGLYAQEKIVLVK